MVGIPVGWRGSVGTILSADISSLPWKGRTPSAAWFSVESADHLGREDHVHGLQGKLDSYLASIGKDPEDYACAYLITAPRCLGYVFNPVSFWYLYDNGPALKAMILEVNNTFDERRMYFLEADLPNDDVNAPPMDKKFNSVWSKDFHVSPFNSRKGTYELSALHPPPSGQTIMNTVVLNSAKKHTKLVARVFSTQPSIDPSAFSSWETRRFLASWWWVGLVTFPRIVREAARLYFRRGLHVWFRPEVLKDSMGRRATSNENAIAPIFASYLQHLVARSTLQQPITYIPTTTPPTPPATFPPPSPTTPPKSDPITLQPTTPLFYARLALAPSTESYLLTTLRPHPTDPAILHTNHPSTLHQLFTSDPTTSDPPIPPLPTSLHLILLLLLRRLQRPSFPAPALSALDSHALRFHPSNSPIARAYRRAVLKLLVAEVFAFGVVEIVEAVGLGVRGWLCWVCAGATGRVFEGGKMGGMGMAGVWGVHLWAGVGGLL